MATDIFAATKRKQSEDEAKALAKQRLDEIRSRQLPEVQAILGLHAAGKGVPARTMKIGEKESKPELSPGGARVRANITRRDLEEQQMQAAGEFANAEAQRIVREMLPQFPTIEPDLASQLEQAVAENNTNVIAALAAKIGIDAKLTNPKEWPKLAEALRTLVHSSVGKLGTDNTPSGPAHVFPAGGGGNPVEAITGQEAAARGLPSDQALTSRAAAGQPVYVGAGDQVARLTGPGQAPVPPSRAMSAHETQAPTPKSPHDHIADIAHGAMKHLGKALTYGNPANLVGDPTQMLGLGGGGAPPTTGAGPVATPTPPPAPPPTSAAPAGERIRVRDRRTGLTGTIPANEWDPNLYELIS